MHPPFPLERFVLEVLLGSHHEESFRTMEAVKLGKIVVGSVEDVVCTRLYRDFLHCLGVMNRRCRNMEKSRYLSLDIVEGMDFYPAFLLPELGPTEDCKAEFDGRGIEGIDRSAKIEYCRIIQLTSKFHHVVGILLEDAAVPVLVSFCQVATSHGVPESEELSLAAVRFHRNNQIAQTFTPRELTEHKNFELIPAGESLYVPVTLILTNEIVELVTVKVRC